MKYRSTDKTITKILLLLAENKEFAQYEMDKKIEKDYRTVLRYVKTLEHSGLIKFSRYEPASKKGKDKKIYKLTCSGLIELLKITAKMFEFKEFTEFLDDIAATNKEVLPLLFGKWSFFQQNGLKDFVAFRIKQAATETPSRLQNLTDGNPASIKQLFKSLSARGMPNWKNEYMKNVQELKEANSKIKGALEEIECDSFNLSVLLWPSITTLAIEQTQEAIQPKDFLLRLRRDSDLKHFITFELKLKEEESEKNLASVRNMLEWWNQ